MYPLVYFWTDRDRNNGRSETEAKSVPGKRSANRADEPEAVARVRSGDPENRAAGAFFGVRSRDRHDNKKGKAPRYIANRLYRCLYGAQIFSTPDHCAEYIRGCMNRYCRSLHSLPKKHMRYINMSGSISSPSSMLPIGSRAFCTVAAMMSNAGKTAAARSSTPIIFE